MARDLRRLAAIIAADVVGYARLMGLDEAGTLARLRENRKMRLEPVLARYRGRLVKLTGDGALVEFASAVDALSAAIEFQQAMAAANRAGAPEGAMEFRLGLHVGDLIVDGDDLYGDGINIAARLEAEALAGGIVVSQAIHEATAGRLDAVFDDLGDLSLKNIARPIRAFRVSWDAAGWSRRPEAISSPAPAGDAVDKPSIAVLPFANMSGDPEQEFFTDGISEDIITELSRFHELSVIARNSSFSYKGRAIDVRTIAGELGVRYVLEGSIRKAANRIRVTGQLIEAASGAHIWADRYDRALEDVFAVQEELTQSIVRAVAPHIRDAELAKVQRRRPEHLGAYEIAVRAHARGWDAYIKSDAGVRDLAIADARAALNLDPTSTIALDALAFAQFQHILFDTTSDRQGVWQEGMAAATRSIELDRTGCFGHLNRGALLAFTPDRDRFDEAALSARRAHELNPHHALAAMALAFIETSLGNPTRAIGLMHAALERSPRDPLRPAMYQQLVLASLVKGEYAEAVRYGLLGIDEAPGFAPVRWQLSVAYVGLGEIEKARAEYDEACRLAPAYMSKQRQGTGGLVRDPTFRRRLLLFRNIAAGIEDPSAADAVR